MIKVNTFKKRSDELYANRPKNQGGLLGGAEYLTTSLIAGIGGFGEGLIDAVGALAYDITGNHDKAEDLFKNNVVGDWYAKKAEEYNPGVVMNFVGDSIYGIGNSSVLLLNAIPVVGQIVTAGYFISAGSQGISSAAAKTGDVGLKEGAYGVTMGLAEGALEMAGGAAAKLGKKVASTATKGTIKSAAKTAVRKGFTKKVLSSAASEFAEEATSEIADHIAQKLYQIDPEKQFSIKDVLYAGAVGAVSGGVMTATTEGIGTAKSAYLGKSIDERGNAQTLVNTANMVADKLAAQGTNFEKASDWVTKLRASVDAYNKIKPENIHGAQAHTILGEIQQSLYYAETQANVNGVTNKIKSASLENREALAEYVNSTISDGKKYTAEDIANNTDNISQQLAIMQYAGYMIDVDAAIADQRREQEISEAIANERNTSTEEAPAATVEDAAFDQAMAMTNEAPANHGAEASPESVAKSDLKEGVPVAGATVFVENVEPTTRGKIEYLENIYEDGSQNLPNLGVPTANPNTYPSVEELDLMGREVRYRLTPDGREVLPDSGVPEYAAFAYPSMSSQVVGEITDADKTAARARTEAAAKFEKENAEQDYESTRSTAQEIKKEADKKQSEAAEEKSSERANKSTESKKEPPKVSEAKESLTDEQRAERARKKAKEMLEWERNNTPTVNELNTAREYVKGFDNLSPERRQSIIRMMRTAKGVDVKTVKGIANLMAIKAGADLDLRFDEEVSEYGASVKSEGRTLIIISSKTDFKNTVEGTVAHELVHYLENKPGYEAFAKYVLKRVKPEKKKEVEDQVTKQYNERYEQIYRKEYTKQGLKGAELNKAVKDALESAQHKAMIDSEVVAELVGQALNSDKFLSRYARIGNTDGFIKKAYTFLRAMVKELKSKDKENNELADIIMPTIKSMDRLLQMGNAGESKSGMKYALDGTPEQIAEWEKPITIHDINRLRAISDIKGEVSINNLTSDEIMTLQKWAYKYWNDPKIKEKSPFFRAWFGEWRSHQTKEFISIATIPEYIATNEARKQNRGTVTNTDTGWNILISREGETNTISHSGVGKLSEYGLAGIRELIANAYLFDTEIHEHHNNNAKNDYISFDHKLYALGLNADGSIGLYKITVEEFYQSKTEPDNKKFHNLKYIEKVADLAGGRTSENTRSGGSTNGNSTTTYSIADLYGFVKTFDKDFSPAPEVSKYVLNEDGTPKVLYHGTRRNFTTFELQDKPTYGRALGDGFYFTSNYDKAFQFANGLFSKGQDRGGIIMPVYLRMQNPYVIKADADRTKWINEYREGEYDGIVDLKNDTYYVEGQTQIKSATDNIGTFDKNNRNIRYSLAPKKSQANVKEVPKIQKQYSLAPKTKNINEKIAREAAENAKVENAQVFAKKDVEIAVRSIEGWTREEILSLATGQENLELQHMNKAKREEMISQIYIALHEEGAKGRVGPGHVAVKALAANIASDYIDSAKIVGENNKSVHLKEIYDESSINQFKQDLTDLLYGEFAHMGHATRNADFQAIIRKQKEEFSQEQLSATRAGKESRNLAYQGKKLRELVEKQKRDATAEDIVKVTKAMADVIDAKGNIRVNAVDKAMSEASRFFEGEKAKIESEKNALKTADGKATYTLSDFAWMANDDIKFMIDEYLRLREGREGKALTAEEMRLASEVLHAMKVTIERYNKEYVNGHWIDAEEAAKDSIADLTAAWREKEYKNKVTEWLGNKVVKGVQEKYFYKILTPETIVETLEGFAKNGLLKSLYHSIRIHKQKAEHLAVQLKKPLAEFMDNKENDWTDDNGHKRRFRSKLNKKMISVNGANGVVDLTLGEAIYLFMLTKREAAHAGLLKNGYIVYNDKNQQRAELKLTDIENTRNNIYNAFDKTDLEFLEMAENFFNKTSSKIKYEADMNIFGYTNVQDGYYVPMIRDRYSRMHGVTDARQSIGSIITVYNKSFNQNLVENAKALEGKNIMSIISDHADGLADYSELYLPLKAFDRIYNRAIVTDDGITSIRRVLNNDVWNGTERYFKDLFADIQGQRDQRDNVVDNLVGSIRSAWVNSVLGANVKVVVTQTTSLAAATQVINAKYIAQTAYLASPGKLPGLQELRERAYKYSDIIEARNFDMGAIKAQGNIDKVTWLGEKSGWAIGWMDERICLAIFHAAELQIQAQYGHAVGTEENAKLAAKLADEAIYTTQAMSSASERSALQRSTSEIAKMFSMFTSDTVKNLSHLYGNIMKWNAFRLRAKAGDGTYAAEMKECGREIRKSVRTLAITGVMLGLITQAFKYLFGKAEEDPEEQKKDLVADVAGSTLNVLPIVSEFVDKIFFDYDMSINVLDVANDTLEAVRGGMKIAGKSIKGEYVSTNDAIKTSTGIIMSGLSFTGLPVSPAERLVTGLLRFASPEAAYGYNSIFDSPSYTSDLKKAVESGDADLAEYILERLYKDEMAGTYTVPELEEIVRLYTLTDEEGNHYNVLPKRTLKKMDDDTELNAAQRKQFNSIYSQASAKVNELIRSEEYKMLDDKAKAKAIRDTYELYYNRAAAEVVGKEWSANQAYSKLTDNYTVLMASKAYKSSLEAYKTDSGKEVTVKEQFSQYVKNLNLSDNDYLIVAYANGYKGKKTTRALLKYINSLDLNEAEKQQIAKALNFDLKNGQFTEKED